MPSQGLVNTLKNRKHSHIRHANNLSYNQPSSFLQRLLTLPVCNRIVVYTKMNHGSWKKLKFMHNIVNFPTAIGNVEGKNMTKISSNQGSGQKSVASNLQLEYEHSHCTRRFHCKRKSAQSSHNHLAHNVGDPNNESSWRLTQNYF